MHREAPETNWFYVDSVFTNFLIWIDGIFFIFLAKQSRSARPRPVRHDWNSLTPANLLIFRKIVTKPGKMVTSYKQSEKIYNLKIVLIHRKYANLLLELSYRPFPLLPAFFLIHFQSTLITIIYRVCYTRRLRARSKGELFTFTLILSSIAVISYPIKCSYSILIVCSWFSNKVEITTSGWSKLLPGVGSTPLYELYILVPRAYNPSGLWLGSRALACPDFLSMRRVFVSHFQPIRFARFDGKSAIRGLSVLDQTRALDPNHRPEGS